MLDIVTKDQRKKILKKAGILPKSFLIKCCNYLAMTLMMAFLAIFFRPQIIQDSIYILQHIASLHFHNLDVKKAFFIFVYIGVLEFFQLFQVNANGHCFEKIPNFYLRAFMYCVLLFSIMMYGSRPEVAFQYFQF
jgi:hypothetical protein